MDRLFEPQRLQALNQQLSETTTTDRADLIMHEVSRSIGEGVDRRVFRHAFMASKAQRVSHYLLFVTKHELGIKLFSDICSREGYNFVFSPNPVQLNIFASGHARHEAIANRLLEQFKGDVISVGTIVTKYDHKEFQSHPSELREVLRFLEEAGEIHLEPASSRRPKMPNGRVTMGDKVLISLP